MFRVILSYLGLNLIVFVNLFILKSPITGFASSVLYIYTSSVMCGNIFFDAESSLHRIICGFFVFICFVSIGGSIALALYKLSSEIIGILLSSTSLILIVLNIKKYALEGKLTDTHAKSHSMHTVRNKLDVSHVLERIPQIMYVLFISASLLLLCMSRSEETYGIWEVIHPAFAPSFFIATFILLIVLFSRASTRVKLFLIVTHSLVIHSVLITVLGHGFWGDVWKELAWTRDIFNLGKNVPNLFEFLSQGRSPYITLYYLLRKRAYQVLVVFFANIFSVDVYWSQTFLTPILWGTLTPLFSFKILKTLGGGENASVFSALLSVSIPMFIWWGALSIPDTLSIVFFVFLLYLLLTYLSSGVTKFSWLFLIFIVTLTSFLAHFKTGAVSVALVLLAFMFRRYKALRYKSVREKFLLVGSMIVCSSFLPLSLLVLHEVYPYAGYIHPQFSVSKLLGTDVWALLFGKYVEYSPSELILYGAVPILGIAGFIYTLMYVPPRRYDRSLCLFLFLASGIFIIDYRIIKYSMVHVPMTPERLWIFRDFLLLPLSAVMIVYLVKKIRRTSSIAFSIPRMFLHKDSVRAGVITLILSLLTSSFVVEAARNAYTAPKPFLCPTTYMIEAIQYIHAKTPEKYVVLSDKHFMYLAQGILGLTSRATYILAGEMFIRPSVNIMTAAMEQAVSSVGYLVVYSSGNYETFRRRVEQSADIFDIYATFGNGKLYVFSYPKVEREYVIPVEIDSGNVSRINYPVGYEINWTRELFAIPGGHLDFYSVRVIDSEGEEVPSQFDHFQVWFENCSTSDRWSTGNSDGDVLTHTAHFTDKVWELWRLKYTEFVKEGGNLTIDTRKHKYMEIKWRENHDNVANIRLGLWMESVEGSWEVKFKWANPSPQWEILRLDLSFLNRTLSGLYFDVFDAKPYDWVGDYELYIDWVRFVGDVGTVCWLYNGTADTKERYIIIYDFLENTESESRDGMPKKSYSNAISNIEESENPPSILAWVPISLDVRTLDLLDQPVSEALVEVKELEMKANTDINGWAHFVAPKGEWTLVISKDGIVRETSVDILANSVITQRLNFVKIDGCVLNTWISVSLIGLVILGCTLLLAFMHRRIFVNMTKRIAIGSKN